MDSSEPLEGSESVLKAESLEVGFGRAGEIRTHDLTHPKRARYQLRYGPINHAC